MITINFIHPQVCFEIGKSSYHQETICLRFLERDEWENLTGQEEWVKIEEDEDRRIAYVNRSLDQVIEIFPGEDGLDTAAYLWNKSDTFEKYRWCVRMFDLDQEDGQSRFYFVSYGKNIHKKLFPLRKARKERVSKYESIYFLPDGRVVQYVPGMASLYNDVSTFREKEKAMPRPNVVIGFSDLEEGTDAKLIEDDSNIDIQGDRDKN